jgi:hypothetical protein
MPEKTFFDYDGVRVTSTRFIVDGQTYAMSNVTSVSAEVQTPNRIIPALLILGGLVLALSRIYAGLLLPIIGIIWWKLQKTIYHVTLHTAGIETSALQTHQKEYLQRVVRALNDAIVYRG